MLIILQVVKLQYNIVSNFLQLYYALILFNK